MRLWHRKQQETKSKSVDFGVHIRCLYDIHLWVSLSIIPSHIFKDAQKHLVDMYFSACQYNQSESNLAFFPWNALGKCPRKFPRKEKAKKQLRKAVKKIGLTFHLSKSEQNEHWLKKTVRCWMTRFFEGWLDPWIREFLKIFVLPSRVRVTWRPTHHRNWRVQALVFRCFYFANKISIPIFLRKTSLGWMLLTGSLEEPTVSSTSEKVPGMDLEAVSETAVFGWVFSVAQ